MKIKREKYYYYTRKLSVIVQLTLLYAFPCVYSTLLFLTLCLCYHCHFYYQVDHFFVLRVEGVQEATGSESHSAEKVVMVSVSRIQFKSFLCDC